MRRRLLLQRLTGAFGLPFLLTDATNGEAAGAAVLKERRFQESRETFPNPERGFYAPRMSGRVTGLEGLRAQGITLLLVEIDLRAFKEQEISPEKLEELRQAFGAARRSGLKIVFRAAYGFTGADYRADPRDMDRILGHIRQIGGVLGEQKDVLFAVQAGFLGPWGEWHGSNWGDPPGLDARRKVLFGLLAAVPSPIPLQVRRPSFVRDIFQGEGGAELTEKTAYSGSGLSRTGWHDDALLALPTDLGTYAQPGWDRERELKWCVTHCRFTPFGGETVPLSAKTPVEQVVRELEQLHATYLNSAYHGGTLRGWREADYRGETAYHHVERRLGYRLVAERLRYTPRVKAGGTLRCELELRNAGFSAPCLPREVALVLVQGSESHREVLKDVDPRRWNPEAGVVRLRAECRVPKSLPKGACRLALHLADPAPALRDDGRYAIRLANQELAFSEATGWNELADDVMIQ